MLVVMGCWVLAMFSGLSWARPYTACLSLVTLGVFLVNQHAALGHWTTWVQAAVFGMTPWLLAGQQARAWRWLKHLHLEEAAAMAALSEATRALLSLQTATQQVEARITQMTELYHVTQETSRTMHREELFKTFLAMMPPLLRVRGIRLIDCAGAAPRAFSSRSSAGGGLMAKEDGALHASDRVILDRVAASAQPAVAEARDLLCDVPDGVSRLAWVAVPRSRAPDVVLVAEELPEGGLATLSIVADQLVLQLARIRLYQQVEALAVTDALTGVAVRRHVMERSQEELARSTRHGLSCTLLMIDLDHFKHKNDAYGHLVGDVVLKEVARLVSRNLREIDLMGRYGGEEFVLLLIETDADQAMPIAQRLKQLVEVHPIRAYDELLTQTISIGVAAFPVHAQTLDELIERADQALYAAKRAGRNRVVLWSAPAAGGQRRMADG